jgi:ribonucleotide reductase beta subunit family protein with ferritin-like domain
MNNMNMINRDHVLNLVKNLEFEEAISHRVHSRVFEILGYLTIVDKEKLPEEIRDTLDSIEELNKKLLEEVHVIIEYYTARKHTEI